MIIGIGTDLVEIKRIDQAREKQGDRFVHRVLTAEELACYQGFSSPKRQAEFLAGRWAAKEACAKAWGSGISKQLSFQDMCILSNKSGQPQLFCLKIPYAIHLSISHTDRYASAYVIIEQPDH
ncbi:MULTISPECIES: holo-ACP synthase [Aerococcus]|uniref:Holo-[acyl-carrier-protein] synthase n=1 Tax=Aerococcus sanguinicola TaxID=119206 RepID=A0A5N1GPF5_9LACT|nr:MULTISPECIES: holo-ACP synthase [Aerococcus]KAA9300590.1 holo-[acyl-carrier-protein] synthase [Aerococcus sanguinicola]MDK6369608.1 holo-ACP synthase [Aerococcus sp. UMB9870]MDK6680113.1 holo-ACP synthase [Aerococcus sp. UMB8608]MDK6686274.1 holo-ACP synthase [Aerococcus sp. UMB8623]MDK6940194.1 holo-ACP synthase [Aerococcus sp. UMB8487]